MNLKGNNAQTYPYSAFILKREFQISVSWKIIAKYLVTKNPSSSNNLSRDESEL